MSRVACGLLHTDEDAPNIVNLTESDALLLEGRLRPSQAFRAQIMMFRLSQTTRQSRLVPETSFGQCNSRTTMECNERVTLKSEHLDGAFCLWRKIWVEMLFWFALCSLLRDLHCTRVWTVARPGWQGPPVAPKTCNRTRNFPIRYAAEVVIGSSAVPVAMSHLIQPPRGRELPGSL